MSSCEEHWVGVLWSLASSIIRGRLVPSVLLHPLACCGRTCTTLEKTSLQMCGIFGFVGRLDPVFAKSCLRRLAHRGPDGESLWHEPGIVLGHRRLAILDLSPAGRQPMSYGAGRY